MEHQSSSNGEVKGGRMWPKPVRKAAYYGLVGDYLRIVDPHTEADPMSLLIQFLVVFGNMIGKGPYFQVENDFHRANLFCLVVGNTSRARKGVSYNRVEHFARYVDADWVKRCVFSGLSSGEGLIQAVLENGANESKSFLVIESEFGRTLKVMARSHNTLSDVVRQAWDGKPLHVLNRKNPLHAKDHYISIIGHITEADLRDRLTETDAANGFGNRFIIVCSERSKLLPNGGKLQEKDMKGLIEKFSASVKFARKCGPLKRDQPADELWEKIYRAIATVDSDGMYGALTARAEPQIMRLACIYALLDQSAIIRKAHLLAAYAVWKYADQSIRYLYGKKLGNTIADVVLARLRENVDGLTSSQIQAIFSRQKSSDQIKQALAYLQSRGLVRCKKINNTGGRPTEMWYARSSGRNKRSKRNIGSK